MKKIGIILSVILLVSMMLCSCGKTEETGSTVPASESDTVNSEESNTAATESEPEDNGKNIFETQTESGSTDETGTENRSSKAEESSTQIPSEMPDALETFNKAASATTATATYSVSGSKASFDPDFINSFFNDEDIAKQNVKNKKITSAKVSKISPSDIKSIDISDNGKEYKITIKLKNVSVAASSEPAQKGYIWFMDINAVMDEIHIVNSELDLKSKGTIALNNGIITASVSKETGKFTSLKLTLDEKINDQVRMESLQSKIESLPKAVRNKLPSEIYGTFDYSLTVNYKF